MGALRVRADDGREFSLGTGFTDAERREPPPVGSQVTYVYLELTRDGVPRFASYWRRREAF
jgi:DNA ligase-1